MKKRAIITVLMLLVTALCLTAQAQDDEETPTLNNKALRELLQRKFPEALKELQELKETDREEYVEELEDLRDNAEYYLYLKKDHPQVAEDVLKAYRLDYQVDDLLDTYFDTEDTSQKEDIKQQIKGMLEQIFDLRLSESRFEADQLRDELREIEELIKNRESSRDHIIANRPKMLTMDADEQSWW